MSQKNRTDLRKKDFLVVRKKTNQDVVKVITPQTFQVGLDDSEFASSLVVKGNAQIAGRLLDSSGTAYIKAGGSVTITEDAAGGITISASLGTGQTLSNLDGGGITTFSYNGTQSKTIAVDLANKGGLLIKDGDSHHGDGLAVDPAQADELTDTPASGDLLLIKDVNAGITKKITVHNLIAATGSFGSLANALTIGQGLDLGSGNSSYNNSSAETLNLSLATDPGLEFHNQKLRVLLNGSTLSRDSSGLSVASVPGQLTQGTGITSFTYDGSTARTIAIDTSTIPVLASNNTFSGKNVFGVSSTSGLTGSLQEVSSGVPYLNAGSNVIITTASNGQITIAAGFAAGSTLSNGSGIASLSYDGTSSATVAVDATSLSTVSVDRTQFLIVADASTPSNISRVAVGSAADIVDRTAIMSAGAGINITFNGNSNPAVIASKVDSDTITTDGSGKLIVSKVPNSLTQGIGIKTFSFDGSSARTVIIDDSVVATLSGSQFSGNVGITGSFGVQGESVFSQAATFTHGLSGSLQKLTDGSSFLREGENIEIVSGSDGSITITSIASSGGSPGGGNSDKSAQYLVLAATGSLDEERVFTAGTGISTTDGGGGNTYTVAIRNDTVATLTGSAFSGDVIAKSGLSGSLQMLSDGVTRYIVGTGGVVVATASNGQLTISGSTGKLYTAGTGLNLSSDEFSVNNSVVATLTGSVFSGNVIAQTGLSGSIQKLSDGTTPYIIGTGSITVTTASSGQIILSSSGGSGGSGGLSTVAQAGGSTVTDVTSLVFTGSTVTNDGGGQVTVSPVIGAPEDGTYTDGLFSAFLYTTPIGTAVDRFNEVLLELAPNPAPALDNVNSNDSGTTAFLSFGAAAAVGGYTSVGASAGFGTAADVNDSYTVASNSGNLRRGIFTLSTTFDGRLNSDISEARYANDQLNYPQYSFGDAEQGEMLLEVNGAVIHTASLTDVTVGTGAPGAGSYSTLNSNGSGFVSLSATASAKFNDGAEFTIFKHRTGNWQVGTADQRNGWNYARVSRIINSVTSSVTNYIEWVNDSDSNALAASNNKITEVDLGGVKRMSGVTYFKSGSAEYRVDVANAYRTVYDNNAITFSTTNLSISNISKPTINTDAGENSSKILSLTGSATITDQTLFSGSVAASVNVTHPLKSDLSTGGSTTAGGFLLYNVADNSTVTSETFRGESFRMQSGSFALQSDVTGGSKNWNSSLHMSGSNTGHTDGLLFYNDLLVAPRNSLLNGDFRKSTDGGSMDFAPVGNPNYSGITSGVRTFYRKFQNTTGGSANSYSLAIQGSNSTSLAGNSESLASNKIKIFAKLPNGGSGNTTGWLDLKSLFVSGTYTDGSGARVYSAPGSLNTTTSGTFGTFDIPNNEFLMVKVLAGADWSGNVSQLDVAFANSNASDASNVGTLTSADDGDDAKLSFGSTKGIPGFTNVGSSAGVGSAANTNDQYLDGTPNAARLGIFDKTTVINGPVNTDSSGGGFADGHTGLLKLELNGSEIAAAEVNLGSFTGTGYPGSGAATNLNGNGTGFTNISTSQPRTGSNNYPDFDKWFRTAQFQVAAADQRDGWNYAKVIHSTGGADRATNYVEWVNDPYVTNMSFESIGFSNFGGPTIFSLSGVKYFDNTSSTVSGSLFASISGSHSNVYSKDADAFTANISLANLSISSVKFEGTGYTTTQVNSDPTVPLPALDTGVANAQSKSLFVTASYTCTLTDSLPEDAHSVTAAFRVKHPQKSTRTSSTQSKSNFLIFSASDSSSVNLSENFSGELYRLQSNNYVNQAAVTSAANKWDSTANMNSASGHDDGLLIYDGKLYSPKVKGNSGDFRNVADGGAYQGPSSNVNYSSLSTATRTYYRAFRNDTSSDVPEILINLTGSAEIIPKSGGFATGSIGSNNFMHVDVKIPGQTAWLDLAKAGDTSNESDGDGCLKGTLNQTINSAGTGILCSFQGATANGTSGDSPPAASSSYVVIRIVADDDWTGNLNAINIGWSG